MECVLQTKELCKQYRHGRALNGLTASVPKGSIYGLIGKNGAGKTTLIRILCGLQRPSAGSFTLFGAAGGPEMARARRRMGAMVETPSLYPDRTAAGNLALQNRVLGLPDDDNIPELLRVVGLENTGPKTVRGFSLGMRQRLGIALALCGSPDFLVLDEPTNGLDPQGIIEMRELILELNREHQITVLISSHMLDELSRLATRYGFIDNGRMIREISAEEFARTSRRRTCLTVSDTRPLARVLDEMGLEYKILSQTRTDVYGHPNPARLARALDEARCELQEIKEKDETLESYFLALVGGDRRA